jgi:phage shock protein A
LRSFIVKTLSIGVEQNHIGECKMGWLDILDEAIEIAKAKLLRVVQALDDPEARFDLAFKEYKEAIRVLKDALVLMEAKKNKFEGFVVKLDNRQASYMTRTKKLVQSGDTEMAEIVAQQIAYTEGLEAESTKFISLLDDRISVVKKELVKAESTQEMIELRGEFEKMRITVAEAETNIYRELTGLKREGTSLFDAVKSLETRREDKEATSEALRELVASGMLPTVAEQMFQEPEEGRVEEILSKLQEEIEKTEQEEEPTIPSEYPKPLETPPWAKGSRSGGKT